MMKDLLSWPEGLRKAVPQFRCHSFKSVDIKSEHGADSDQEPAAF